MRAIVEKRTIVAMASRTANCGREEYQPDQLAHVEEGLQGCPDERGGKRPGEDDEHGRRQQQPGHLPTFPQERTEDRHQRPGPAR